MPDTDIVVSPQREVTPSTELSIDQVVAQVGKIQDLMKSVMKNGEHFGVIPGTEKPTLLNPGAQKICFTFRLGPRFTIERFDLPREHREYQVRCELYSLVTGMVAGEGVGLCSTMEKKYRYRAKTEAKEIGEVPKGYWNIPKDDGKAKAAFLVKSFGPGKYRTKKIDNQWTVLMVTSDGEMEENPDIADTYNTVLKMAKKRAYVDAVLTVTAASDFFTQDVEDFAEGSATAEPAPNEAKKPAAAPAPAASQNPIQPGYVTPDYKGESYAMIKKLGLTSGEILPQHGGKQIEGTHWGGIDWKAVYEDLKSRPSAKDEIESLSIEASVVFDAPSAPAPVAAPAPVKTPAPDKLGATPSTSFKDAMQQRRKAAGANYPAAPAALVQTAEIMDIY